MKPPKGKGITVMVLMPMAVCSITLVGMKFQKASLTRIRFRRIMHNYAIIWLANPAVSRLARMLFFVPFDC